MNPNPKNADQSERVGLFGGTFNPIHKGHLAMAEAVLRQYGLDKVIIIPSAQPPHKSMELAPAQDRLRMVHLALNQIPGLQASDIEIQRTGYSYTIDTLHYFRARLKPGGQLFFILGADAFIEIYTWKAYRNLFEEAAFIVLPRPPHSLFDRQRRRALREFVIQRISSDYAWDEDEMSLYHPRNLPIHLAVIDPVDISSTQIRQSIREGRPLTDKLTKEVWRYIMEKGLYR